MKSFCFYSCCESAGNPEDSCGCGHEHEYETETCGCGYDIEDCTCAGEESLGCGCGNSASACGCGSDSYDAGCGCGSQEGFGGGCGCGGGGCGCGGGQRDAVLIRFDDGTEYECPVLSIFDINEQEYIALYHPAKQKALLYRFMEGSQGVMLDSIEDEAEFELVANAFRNL